VRHYGWKYNHSLSWEKPFNIWVNHRFSIWGD